LVKEAAASVELDLVEVAVVESSDGFPVTTFTTYLILSAACFGRDLVGAYGIFFNPEYFESALGAVVAFLSGFGAFGTKPAGIFGVWDEAAAGAGLSEVTTAAEVDFAGAFGTKPAGICVEAEAEDGLAEVTTEVEAAAGAFCTNPSGNFGAWVEAAAWTGAELTLADGITSA
jgi:hypothetical protein